MAPTVSAFQLIDVDGQWVRKGLIRGLDGGARAIAIWGPEQGAKSTIMNLLFEGANFQANGRGQMQQRTTKGIYAAITWRADGPILLLDIEGAGSVARGGEDRAFEKRALYLAFESCDTILLNFKTPQELINNFSTGYGRSILWALHTYAAQASGRARQALNVRILLRDTNRNLSAEARDLKCREIVGLFERGWAELQSTLSGAGHHTFQQICTLSIYHLEDFRRRDAATTVDLALIKLQRDLGVNPPQGTSNLAVQAQLEKMERDWEAIRECGLESCPALPSEIVAFEQRLQDARTQHSLLLQSCRASMELVQQKLRDSQTDAPIAPRVDLLEGAVVVAHTIAHTLDDARAELRRLSRQIAACQQDISSHLGPLGTLSTEAEAQPVAVDPFDGLENLVGEVNKEVLAWISGSASISETIPGRTSACEGICGRTIRRIKRSSCIGDDDLLESYESLGCICDRWCRVMSSLVNASSISAPLRTSANHFREAVAAAFITKAVRCDLERAFLQVLETCHANIDALMSRAQALSQDRTGDALKELLDGLYQAWPASPLAEVVRKKLDLLSSFQSGFADQDQISASTDTWTPDFGRRVQEQLVELACSVCAEAESHTLALCTMRLQMLRFQLAYLDLDWLRSTELIDFVFAYDPGMTETLPAAKGVTAVGIKAYFLSPAWKMYVWQMCIMLAKVIDRRTPDDFLVVTAQFRRLVKDGVDGNKPTVVQDDDDDVQLKHSAGGDDGNVPELRPPTARERQLDEIDSLNQLFPLITDEWKDSIEQEYKGRAAFGGWASGLLRGLHRMV